MGSRFVSPRRAVAVLAVAGALFGGGAVAAMQANAATPTPKDGYVGSVWVNGYFGNSFVPPGAGARTNAWNACAKLYPGAPLRSVKSLGVGSRGGRALERFACSASPTP